MIATIIIEHRVITNIYSLSYLMFVQGLSCESGAAKRIVVLLTEDLAHSNKLLRPQSLPKKTSQSVINNNDNAIPPNNTSPTATTNTIVPKTLVENISSTTTSPNTNTTAPGVEEEEEELMAENEVFMDSRSMSNAIYGLQNTTVTKKSKHMHKLLLELAEAITISPHPFTAQGVGNSLYGLQRMSSEVSSVRILLAAITKKIWRMPWSAEDSTFVGSLAYLGVERAVGSSSVDAQFDKYYMLSGQNIGNSLW